MKVRRFQTHYCLVILLTLLVSLSGCKGITGVSPSKTVGGGGGSAAVVVTAPTAGSSVTGMVNVSANVTGTVAGVQFLVDDAPLGAEITSAPYSSAWNSSGASNGSHNLKAKARDASGSFTTSAAVSVIVANGDTILPTVSIGTPVSGANVTGVVTITATATDNTKVEGVTFYSDGSPIAPEVTTATNNNYSLQWDSSTASDGTHALTAQARDTSNNLKVSTAVSVNVSNAIKNTDSTAPTVPQNLLATPSSANVIIVSWSDSTDNVGVAGYKVFRNGTQVGTTTTPFYTDYDLLPSTSYTYTASAFDAAGNNSANAVPFSATTPSLSQNNTDLGKGCTTAYHIDEDCDGYGIGPNLNGPDADDNDPNVNTPNSVSTKYGSLSNFLTTVKGYTPTRYWFIDTSGNNSTCAPSADASVAASHPCQSLRNNGTPGPFDKAGANGLQPGDIVIWNAGTYSGQGNYYMGSPVSGTAANPIIFMANPGALVRFSVDHPAFSNTSINYVTLDGLEVDLTPSNFGANGMQFYTTTGLTLRNNWIHNSSNGMMLQWSLHDLLVEHNLISDSQGSHCLYMGQNADHDGGGRVPVADPPNPNSNLTIRNNLIYRCGSTHIQHNGAVTNLLIEGNIVHSSHLVMNAIALLEGVRNSIVRNNLVFNVWGSGVQVYTYDDNSLAIWPRSQHDILIENNTLITNCYNGATESTNSSQCFAQIAIQDNSGAQLPMYNFTVRNNLMIGTTSGGHDHVKLTRYAGDGDPSHGHACNYGGTWTACSGYDNGLDPVTTIIPTTTFENNLLWPLSNTDVYIRNRCAKSLGSTDLAKCTGTGVALADKEWSWAEFSSTARDSGFGVLDTLLNVDPLFTSYTPPDSTTGNQNFSLTSGSPAINAGSKTGAPSIDLKGKARDTTPDIGAFEF